MIMNRQVSTEKVLNSCMINREKFNFDEFCNNFALQNEIIFRIVVNDCDISKVKDIFFHL